MTLVYANSVVIDDIYHILGSFSEKYAIVVYRNQ
jgi:hypothetical protein